MHGAERTVIPAPYLWETPRSSIAFLLLLADAMVEMWLLRVPKHRSTFENASQH